jgi:hypothetical protein
MGLTAIRALLIFVLLSLASPSRITARLPLAASRPLQQPHGQPVRRPSAAATAAAALAAERVAAVRGGGLAALGRRLQQFAIGVPVGPIRRGVAREQENINLIQLTLALHLQGRALSRAAGPRRPAVGGSARPQPRPRPQP